ncbi:MAG TPA: helix-turn-helix domain-containing protein [Gemmatimonadales bacterium]
MAAPRKRKYVSAIRDEAAGRSRRRILDAAASLFARSGIDRVTIAQIAARAKVSVPTVYALFKSKEGILHAILESALFGPAFQAARARLEGVTDPVVLIERSAAVARAIYESESTALGLMRGASAFSPALRKAEQAFEDLRYSMQEARVRLLFDEGKARPGLGLDEARRILWMYTGRDIYRMLVQEGGWSPDEYEAWLARTLVTSLVRPESR